MKSCDDPLERLENEAWSAASEIDTYEVPECLWHYTSVSAFESMMRNRELWAFDGSKSNDGRDLVAANDPAIDAARVLTAERAPSSWSAEICRAFAEGYLAHQVTKRGTVFVFSCSAARDTVDQWDRYASHGAGVCIGFRPESMQVRSGLDYSDPAPVVYRPSRVKGVLLRRFRSVLDAVDDQACTLPGRAKEIVDLGVRLMLRIAGTAALTTKDEGWQNEREWRLVAWDSHEVHTHRNGRMYVTLPFEASAVVEVIVGPCQRNDAFERTRKFLASVGFRDGAIPMPRICASQCALRPRSAD